MSKDYINFTAWYVCLQNGTSALHQVFIPTLIEPSPTVSLLQLRLLPQGRERGLLKRRSHSPKACL